jgi:hypothetical protein
VVLDNTISENDIKIVLTCDNSKTTIFEKGLKSIVPNEYGENDWLISYKDSLFVEFRHFKTNRNSNHKYNCRFYKKQNTLYCDIDIIGSNKFKNTLKFN